MASLSPKARKSFVAGLSLTPLTARPHTDPDRLLDELGQIKTRGYALDQEEFIDGMVAIAVPVLNSQGRFAAALAFHGPGQRMPIETAIAKQDVLTVGARRLTEALFS